MPSLVCRTGLRLHFVIPLNAYVYVYICKYMFVCAYKFTDLYMNVCLSVYIYIYVCYIYILCKKKESFRRVYVKKESFRRVYVKKGIFSSQQHTARISKETSFHAPSIQGSLDPI